MDQRTRGRKLMKFDPEGTGPFAYLLARFLAMLIHSLVLHCSLRSRALLCSFVCSLAHSLAPNIFVYEMNAKWLAIVWKRRIHFKDKPLSHELGSEWASKRANEWAQRSAQAKRAVQSKRMSERCEQMSDWTSEWPSTQRVEFIDILPIVELVNFIQP